MSICYEAEREFFDAVAAQTVVTRMSPGTLERYARPRRPHLFAKEMMFAAAGDLAGKRVLEIGCGEGVASVQLAFCGARVTGIDLSPVSLDVARRRAALHGVEAEFVECNLALTDTLGRDRFDVVWCDSILHHVVPVLDDVLGKLARALKPGGLFVSREPVAYAGWLKGLRRWTPVKTDATDDEQPLRESEWAVIRKHFPTVEHRHYRILARIDRVTGRLPLIAGAARVDNALLRLPGMKALAGTAVMWAQKPKD